MAVVFISPQQRQRVFFIMTVIVVIFFAMLFSALIFLAKPPKVSIGDLFNQNKITINAAIFDKDQFKALLVFPKMPSQFSYRVAGKTGKVVEGSLSASSLEDAKSILGAYGVTILDIQEINTFGRDNPFAPYTPVTSITTTPQAATPIK